MNYTLYLQNGALLELPLVENRLGEKEVAELYQRIIQGDEEAAAILVDNAIKDPENGWITDVIVGAKEAAEQGTDDSAKQFWGIVGPLIEQAQRAQSLKCGGKVRAKVKKACGGKKMEKGSKVPEVKKGGCPCMYKKVGGRIIKVDCNGIPVAKDGAVLYAQPGNQLPSALASDAVTSYMTAPVLVSGKDVKNFIIRPWRLIADITIKPAYLNVVKPVINFESGLLKLGYNKIRNYLNSDQQNNDIPLSKLLTPNEIAAQQAVSRQGIETYYQTPEGLAVVAKVEEEAAKRQAAEEAERRAQEVAARRNAFGAGKLGTFGGLTYDEALKRQKEMQAAKAQGFNVDLGRWGADGKWGRQSSGEWARYQLWKKDLEAAQELAAMKAQNANLTKLEPLEKYFFAGSDKLLNIPGSKVEVTIPKMNKFIAANVGDSNIRLASKYLQAGGKMPYADYLK